jgi:hypothetical protein
LDNDLRNSGLLFVKPTLPITAKAHPHLIVYPCRGGFETRPYDCFSLVVKEGARGSSRCPATESFPKWEGPRLGDNRGLILTIADKDDFYSKAIASGYPHPSSPLPPSRKT